VYARFAPELLLRLSTPNWLVYHHPDEDATIRGLATWRGRPLARARVTVTITCPGDRSTVALTTGEDGRISFVFGSDMPNSLRVLSCHVTGRVSARERTARGAAPHRLRFIHPLWLETRIPHGKLIIRAWGREHESVELFANGRMIGRATIGRSGWVDIRSAPIRRGDRLWVKGPHGHTTHVITA
jgi:hypothetical protein